jgi:hypothetical protein
MKGKMNRFIWRILCRVFACRQWPLFRLTGAGQLLAAGIFVSAIFGVNTHDNLSHQIFCFLIILAFFALMGGRRFYSRLTLVRRLPRYATAGRAFTYRLWVSNNSSRAHTDLEFREIIGNEVTDWPSDIDSASGEPPAGGNGRFKWTAYWTMLKRNQQSFPLGRAALERLDANEREGMSITIEPEKRGRLDFKGVAVNKIEPLGLFKSQALYPLHGTVLVLPSVYRLPSVVLSGKRQFQPGGIALAASVGDSEEFVALRDYRAGDPLRRIHWKSWAKTGKPVVKEYQEEFFVRHALVLDTFCSVKEETPFEEAVSLAASFVSAQPGERLLDLMFVGPQAYCFTCGRGLLHTDKMLEILSGVSICSNQPFDTMFPLVLKRASQLSACICIFLSWDENRRRLVGMLRQLSVPVEVFLITSGKSSDNREPGPMQDKPHRFHVLKSGSVQEELELL